MREENKLNKAIKQDGIDTQADILEGLKRRYPQYVKQPKDKQAPAKKRRMAVIFAFAAVAVCAAIIIPCAVLLPENNDGNGNIRYCGQDEYRIEEVDYTIGEYRENNHRNFLYFDWYEVGEDCNTFSYISNSDNEVLGLEECIYLIESDELVQLSITKSNVYLSEFDLTITNCENEHFVDSHTVKWGIKESNALCVFEDSGYRYFIQIKQGQDENRLFELVTELLGTK